MSDVDRGSPLGRGSVARGVWVAVSLVVVAELTARVVVGTPSPLRAREPERKARALVELADHRPVVVVGSSDADAAIDARRISDLLGRPVYNAALAGMGYGVLSDWVDLVIDAADPPLVLLAVSPDGASDAGEKALAEGGSPTSSFSRDFRGLVAEARRSVLGPSAHRFVRWVGARSALNEARIALAEWFRGQSVGGGGEGLAEELGELDLRIDAGGRSKAFLDAPPVSPEAVSAGAMSIEGLTPNPRPGEELRKRISRGGVEVGLIVLPGPAGSAAVDPAVVKGLARALIEGFGPGAVVVDASELPSRATEIFYADSRHLNARGSRLVSDKVADGLLATCRRHSASWCGG